MAHLARGIRLLAIHLVKHLLEAGFELFILRALVELAHKVAAAFERVAREAQGRGTEVLYSIFSLSCFACVGKEGR